MKLGVFDSGIGGEAVAATLRMSFPDADVIIVNDRDHVPYGDRTIEDIQKLTDTAVGPLLKEKCDVIVIACNSATAAAIEMLREKYPSQLFIGLEPMIKPACEQTKSGVVAVCATPATLASPRYQKLKEKYAGSTIIIEPDCRSWAQMIENDQIDEMIIKTTINDVCEQGADVIALACTHYHWIRTIIEKTVQGRATVLDPSSAIVNRVQQLLESR